MEDDSIELLELESELSAHTHVIKKSKKLTHNKIGSPPHSAISSASDGTSRRDISKLFVVKAKSTKKSLDPKTTDKIEVDSKENTIKSDTSEKYNVSNKTYVFDTNKSDTHSYRNKLRERFNLKKIEAEKIENIVSIAGSSKETATLKRNNTFTKIPKQESEDYIEQNLENDEIDAYAFFCYENYKPERTNDQEETESVTSEAKNGKRSEDLVSFSLPESLFSTLETSEASLFWLASSKPIDIQKKIRTEEEQISEGKIFDHKCIPKRQINLLEQRLFAASDKDFRKWYNDSGNLSILKNPCSEISYRPNKTSNTYFTEYFPAGKNLIDNCDEIVIHKDVTLFLHIYNIKFLHHSLFSAEHILKQKLFELYSVYEQKKMDNTILKLSEQLNSLRAQKHELHNRLAISGDALQSTEELEMCYKNISDTRKSLVKESKEERECLIGIVTLWRSLKRLRSNNGYSSTSAQLIITKKECDVDAEEEDLNNKIEETVSEVLSELNFDYEKKMRTYKEELQQWRDNKESDVEIVVKKPKRPFKKINEETIKEEVTEQFKESFKPPGEPILFLNLTDGNKITKTAENSREKLRRRAVSTTKIYLRILSDDVEVCETKSVSLNEKFVCEFNEFLSIQFSNLPKKLVVEIYEKPGTLLKRTCGEVELNIPESSVIFNENNCYGISFEQDGIIRYKHEGVGSGIYLDSIPELNDIENKYVTKEMLNTKCHISYNIGWEEVKQQRTVRVVENINNKMFEELVSYHGTLDKKKLVSLANDIDRFREEDSKNNQLYDSIKTFANDRMFIKEKYLRLNPLIKSFEFCEPIDIENNMRFKILELRNRNEPEFVGMIVPNRLKEIPINVLQNYKHRINYDEQKLELVDDNSIEVKRSYCRKYLNRIFMKVFQQCRCSQNNLLFEDVVDEKYLAHFEFLVRILVFNFLNYFKFQPQTWKVLPKFAMRKQDQDVDKMKSQSGMVQIVISVKSGTNIPQRLEGTGGVKPFLEVTYGNVTVQSLTAVGSSPVWNQELTIPLETTHTDYLNPDSLNDSLHINLFDDIQDDVSEVSKKRNWLGCLEIPISAISYSTKMEGLFKLKMPTITFCYEQETLKSTVSRTSANQTVSQFCNLNMAIKLQPSVPKLSPSLDEWACIEVPYVKDHITKWNDAYNMNFPTRRFSVLVINTNRKTTCITRYIRPLDPPQLHEEFEVTADQCARYVSMIPFTNNNKFYQNVCLTTDELLKLMLGSVVDHAIALTCYLLSLNLEAWILFGFGIPNGITAYVLLRAYSNESQLPTIQIYDVVTATKYNIEDPLCPLQKIFCIVNERNVLANIQKNDFLKNTRFDFTKKSDWLPLFNDKIPSPSNSIQQKLTYVPEDSVYNLEIRIDKKIRKKFMKLRKIQRTIWNRDVSNVCKSVMKKMETICMHNKSYSDVYTELCRATSKYKVSGSLIYLPFNSITSIVDRVLSYGVHLNGENDVQFALSVYIHEYPSQIFVVWLFIGTVLSNKI